MASMALFFWRIKMEPQYIEHTLDPVYDAHSEILILGTMPSPKSRQTGFYYGHPQNRFWKVLAAVFNEPVPETIGEKRNSATETILPYGIRSNHAGSRAQAMQPSRIRSATISKAC